MKINLFTKPDKISEKFANTSSDSSDKDEKNEDFASFFTVPPLTADLPVRPSAEKPNETAVKSDGEAVAAQAETPEIKLTNQTPPDLTGGTRFDVKPFDGKYELAVFGRRRVLIDSNLIKPFTQIYEKDLITQGQVKNNEISNILSTPDSENPQMPPDNQMFLKNGEFTKSSPISFRSAGAFERLEEKTAEKLKKSDFSSEETVENEDFSGRDSLEQIKKISAGETPEKLKQTEKEFPKDEKQLKSTENLSDRIFDKFSNGILKEPKIADNSSPDVQLNEKIIEQVEPQILELAASVQTGNEKRILKMRLHPAELGTVEIRIEKNSSGQISAYLQTDNEKAHRVLRESLGQLRDSLENSGCRVGQLEISGGLTLSSNGGKNREDQSPSPTVENQSLKNAGYGLEPDTPNGSARDQIDRLVSLRA